MNLTSPSAVKQLMADMDIVPNRVLGQNFLIDKNILDILIDRAELSSRDSVLEIGGGLGVVTERLAGSAGMVKVVEKDRRLARHLEESFAGNANVTVIYGDALDLLKESSGGEGSSLLSGSVNKVVANLPYSVGTRILVEIIKSVQRPEKMVLTLQLEVAERLAAAAGCKEYGILSVLAGLCYDIELVKTVSQNCFWPRPDVKSGIVSMNKHERLRMSSDETAFFYKLTKHAFGHRRKQMISILREAPEEVQSDVARTRELFSGIGIAPEARPGDLSVEDWAALAIALKG